jgi:hypothetical protein
MVVNVLIFSFIFIQIAAIRTGIEKNREKDHANQYYNEYYDNASDDGVRPNS